MQRKTTELMVIGGAGFGAGILATLLMRETGAKVTISPNPAHTGDVVTWTFSGFPANVQLMSMGGGTNGIASNPVNIGTTDANGGLVIQGGPDMPVGNTVLYAVFVATNPEIYATTIYKVV